MLKAVLAPKSIENQFIKRVWQGKQDAGLVKEVLTPVGTDILRVCLCMDGDARTSSHASVLACLKKMFEWWGMRVQIEISSFTFVTADPAHEAAMMQLLDDSNLFYFCGISQMTGDLRQALTVSPLVDHLRFRIQYNEMSFFGVCGGAMMAGATTPYGCPGLDIFDGFTVHYDAHISGAAATLKTNFRDRVMQMMTGCALAVAVTYDKLAATSFCTIKKPKAMVGLCSSQHGSNVVARRSSSRAVEDLRID